MKSLKNCFLLGICAMFAFMLPQQASAQWVNSPSTRLYTYDQVIIDRTTAKYSWLELDVNGTIGTEGLDMYTESSTSTGWTQQITWNNPSGRRHILTDHGGTDRLLFYVGIGGGAKNEMEIHGKLGVGRVGTINMPTTVGGINISAYNLYVEGGILTEELRVRTDWADYVFAEDYELKSLEEVEAHIDENGYLHNTLSAAEVEAQGIEVGEMTKNQQEKIEELFLHMIDMNKRLKQLEEENAALKAKVAELEK